MNRAALYQRSNGLQRRDAKQVIDEFAQCLQWRPDGQDSLLDIGCGSGDVTIDFVLPVLPRNFARLVGVDLSEQMIRHAREQYPHPNISFDKMDIGGDIEKYLCNLEPFDHITSFYCLHWVQNQKKAIQNIHRLLQPDGDCLLAFLANNPIFEVYKRMSQSPKWAQYMTDVDVFISPYQYSKAPADELGALMYAAGFAEYSVELREQLFIFEGVDILKKSVKAVNPFLERIPKNQHEVFLDDYVNVVASMQLSLDNADTNDKQFLTPYKLMIAYGRK